MNERIRPGETVVSPSAETDVSTELTALQADLAGLADSVKRLASEAPDLTKQGLEELIRRNPTQSVMVGVGTGFVLGLLLTR